MTLCSKVVRPENNRLRESAVFGGDFRLVLSGDLKHLREHHHRVEQTDGGLSQAIVNIATGICAGGCAGDTAATCGRIGCDSNRFRVGAQPAGVPTLPAIGRT
jgi:hypothetical protein